MALTAPILKLIGRPQGRALADRLSQQHLPGSPGSADSVQASSLEEEA